MDTIPVIVTEKAALKARLKTVNGKIESLNKDFRLTAEAAEELAAYWQRVKAVIERCKPAAEDSIQAAICKAYILESGRETATFERLRKQGIKIQNQSSSYSGLFLATIFPADEKEAAEAAEAVKDADLLEVVRAIGKMRNP